MARYIEDLSSGDKVEGVFIINKMRITPKRSGENYIFIELRDRTGTIPAFVWDDVEENAEILKDEFYIRVIGEAETYNGRLQVRVHALSRADVGAIKMEDLFQSSPRDQRLLEERLQAHIKSITNPWFKKLVEQVFGNNDFYNQFITSPAAIKKHHNYLNGLLDHTVEVCDLAVAVSGILPDLDHDLILAGALIHDIGKIAEYKIGRGIEFTEKGNLIGHIILGYEMVVKEIESIDGFPEEIRMKILHMILSHHGKEEWGSPKKPAIPEAYLLHTLDNLSSKIHREKGDFFDEN
ncbi:MAG TPA: HD domain-containing protein [bacterium (Candidatus Stahlbacteria)]|nr:HD domain-containing protein [Candidatus Stahlbacteria bacterium]